MAEERENPAARQRLSVSIEDKLGAVTFHLGGELDCFSLPSLMPKLKPFREIPACRIIFNLRQVHYLDSTVLSFLISNHRDFSGRGGRMVCVRPKDPQVQKVLTRTWVTSILQFADDMQEAERFLAAGGQPD